MNRLSFRRSGRSFLPLRYAGSFLLLPLLLFFGPAPGAYADALIRVYADNDNIKGFTNPLVFGQNVMASSNTMWDHRTDSLRSELDDSKIIVKSKIEGLAPTILRFPGGTASDLGFWEDGLGGGEGCRIIPADKADGAAGDCDLPDPGN